MTAREHVEMTINEKIVPVEFGPISAAFRLVVDGNQRAVDQSAAGHQERSRSGLSDGEGAGVPDRAAAIDDHRAAARACKFPDGGRPGASEGALVDRHE